MNANASALQAIRSEPQMTQLIKENTQAALDACNWKIYGTGGVAELLELKPTTLVSRINKMGLKKSN